MMKVQVVNITDEKIIVSGSSREDIRVKRSGIAKVLWRNLEMEVPASTVVFGGVEAFD